MFSLENFSHQKIPKLPWREIIKDILGDDYELSLVFIGEKKAKELNKKFRNKNYIPNILSFPLEKKIGEIFICPLIVKNNNQNKKKYEEEILHLFIHGCLHLKGVHHSSKMRLEEEELIKKYR